MTKYDLQLEMKAALRAASIHSVALESLLLESAKSGEPTRELGMKICATEEMWIVEMTKYSAAFKNFNGA